MTTIKQIVEIDKEISSIKIDTEKPSEFKKLGELAIINGGAILARLAYDRKTVPMKAQILMPRAINNGLIDKDFISESKIKDSVKDKFFTSEGDIVIEVTNPFDCCVADKEYIVPSFCTRISLKNKKLNYYILSFLNSEAFLKPIKEELPQGKILTIERVKNILVPIYSEEKMSQVGNLYQKILLRRQLVTQLKEKENKTFSKIFNK